MLRDASHDRARAIAAIEAVLENQWDAPGTVYHGTFRRWPGEPDPPHPATMWRDYDPNWRQFVGTTLALLLEEYDTELPRALIGRMDRAIRLAVVGEPPERCAASYTNIALMKAALMTWAGDRYGDASWTHEGERFGGAVYDLFQTYGAFAEYNSPTYYGVNLFALALWRRYAKSDALAEMGSAMEAALWRDIAAYYHAGLRNIAGPYTRSYGMDMQHYAALLGLSIWLLVGRDAAPFPEAAGYFDHSHDYCYGPALALAGSEAPAEALPHFTRFQGARTVERKIMADAEDQKPARLATAWLGDAAMFGAEGTVSGSALDAFTRVNQFHPVTLHWQAPGGVGWMRLHHLGPIAARAEPGELTLDGAVADPWAYLDGEMHRRYRFEIHVPGGVDAAHIRPTGWDLPGLALRVITDATWSGVEIQGATAEAVYTAPERRASVALRFELI
jgi:hypothetical protein